MEADCFHRVFARVSLPLRSLNIQDCFIGLFMVASISCEYINNIFDHIKMTYFKVLALFGARELISLEFVTYSAISIIIQRSYGAHCKQG